MGLKWNDLYFASPTKDEMRTELAAVIDSCSRVAADARRTASIFNRTQSQNVKETSPPRMKVSSPRPLCHTSAHYSSVIQVLTTCPAETFRTPPRSRRRAAQGATRPAAAARARASRCGSKPRVLERVVVRRESGSWCLHIIM